MSDTEHNITEFVLQCIDADHDAGRERLLQHLIAIQYQYRFIPAAAIEALSDRLAVSATEIESIVSFYSFLVTEDPGEYHILISDNITDRMVGNDDLHRQLTTALGERPVTIGFTSCIGLPDQEIGVLVNGWAIPRVDQQRAQQIIELIKARQPVSAWPNEMFAVTDNIRLRDRQLQTQVNTGQAIGRVLVEGEDWLLQQLAAAGLRGRGGAGFPTEKKWRLCRGFDADEHFVVCNADEGEPGTFKDRVLLNSDPDSVIEGMTICARVIGATRGYIYLRSEYRYLKERLENTLQQRRQQGLLGDGIRGQSDFDFDIEIHMGAGAYICGEESALIESLQGGRGIPRARPPFPVESGFRYKPTVVDNVETFWSAARIAVKGGDWFSQVGTEQSRGTRLLSISGDCAAPGIYEYPFGTTIEQILQDCGGEDAMAVQVSGAAGHMVFAEQYQRQLSFEDIPSGGSFMVFGPERNILDVLHNFAEFFKHESCGFCTPCRNGTAHLLRHIQHFQNRQANPAELEQLRKLLGLLKRTSFCGLGCSVPTAFEDVLTNAPQVFTERMIDTNIHPDFDLDSELSEFNDLARTRQREPKHA